MSRDHKLQVSFGGTTPEWTSSATLLGVLFDAKLLFKDELSRIADKTYKRTFRVFNHVDWVNGLSVSKLLEIYSIWIDPVLSYGCAVWIFQVFPDIRLGSSVSYGYTDYWNALHREFRGLMRGIAGVSKRTNFNAVLVRLGVLPLHYTLAAKAMAEYYRIYTGKAGPAMTDLLDSFDHGDSEWKQTRFFSSAHNNIVYFQSFVEDPLLEAPSSKAFSARLRLAMFAETTASWQRQCKAEFTKQILPIWCESHFEQPLSKATETVLIKSCFTQNYTRSFLTKHSTSDSTCRLCNNAPETIEHLFYTVPKSESSGRV